MVPDTSAPGPPGKGTLRELLFFFLRFIAVSFVLYLVYIKAGFLYMQLVARAAKPVLALFGYELIMKNALQVTEEISLNPIVFLSLVTALAGVPIGRKVRSALLGVAILTLANIITIVLVFVSYYMRNERLWTGTEFLNLTINFFLPLLLWFILMPVRKIFPTAGLGAGG
ncbi:MAG: hypothetical protein JXB45_10620 [Candidatus Krumholzibacteriota bacterium]|nr:hypothetical protein [Candidatus Krumholzibacteriota bacterium]